MFTISNLNLLTITPQKDSIIKHQAPWEQTNTYTYTSICHNSLGLQKHLNSRGDHLFSDSMLSFFKKETATKSFLWFVFECCRFACMKPTDWRSSIIIGINRWLELQTAVSNWWQGSWVKNKNKKVFACADSVTNVDKEMKSPFSVLVYQWLKSIEAMTGQE